MDTDCQHEVIVFVLVHYKHHLVDLDFFKAESPSSSSMCRTKMRLKQRPLSGTYAKLLESQ